MREIRFRLWDKQYNQMLYIGREFEEHIHEKEPSHYMQYTGLKDINGVEIYEGDIITGSSYLVSRKAVVKFGQYEQDGSGGEYNPIKCLGFYSEAIAGQVDNEGDALLYDFDLSTSLLDLENLKVIGNIYKNSELLEG